MFFATINRKTICLVLVLLTISLVSLGIRMPWPTGISSSSAKPKARPRAIIENQIKTCKQVIKDISSVVAVLENSPTLVTAVLFIRHAQPDSFTSPESVHVQKNSRAPPVIV